MTTEPIRVLLVDDHEMVRFGFRTIIGAQDDMEVVGEASTGREAIEQNARLAPQVICMDVQMPDMDGLEATRQIVADDTSDAAVLILTTFDRDDYLFEALHAGASGFLLKNSGPENLLDAVRVLASGDALLSPVVTKRVLKRFTRPATESSATVTAPQPSAALDELTARETEVLELVAEGLSNSEIADRLFLGEATVKTHVSKILQKLQLRDRIQAVVFAYENGVAVPGSS